jgi:hypothetical protein
MFLLKKNESMSTKEIMVTAKKAGVVAVYFVALRLAYMYQAGKYS